MRVHTVQGPASTSNVNRARFVLVVSSSVVGGRNSSYIDTGRNDSEASRSVQAWDRDRDDDRSKMGPTAEASGPPNLLRRCEDRSEVTEVWREKLRKLREKGFALRN